MVTTTFMLQWVRINVQFQVQDHQLCNGPGSPDWKKLCLSFYDMVLCDGIASSPQLSLSQYDLT